MLKRLNPEIVLGFLTATVFWILILGWQSSYAPTEKEKQECQDAAKKSGHKTEECKTIWERTTTDPVALFTFVLCIFTAGLAGSTVALWLATRRTAKIAETALTDLERPWLFLEGTTIRRRDLPGQPLTPNFFFIKLRWKNIGRSPALTEKCICEFRPKVGFPTEPIYSKDYPGLMLPYTVTVGQSVETSEVGPAPGKDEILVFYGLLTYTELNGKSHETGFAVEISPHIPACSPHGSKKYDYYT